MRHVLAACAALLLAPLLSAGDIEFDGPAEVAQHTIAKVRAKSAEYKSFVYKVYGPTGQRVATERGEGGWVLFTGVPGKYRVEAIAGKTDKDGNLLLDEGQHEVTIKGKAPDPGPDPGPKPPTDPLTKAIVDAYARESIAGKKGHAEALAAVYANGAKMVRAATVGNYGQLATVMTAGVKAAGVEGKLPLIKAAIDANGKYLRAKNTTAIDETIRYSLAAELETIAAALTEVTR